MTYFDEDAEIDFMHFWENMNKCVLSCKISNMKNEYAVVILAYVQGQDFENEENEETDYFLELLKEQL